MAKLPTLPKHHIQGLSELFHDHAGAEKGNDNFPPGCTIVLTGPPGAGKTTFALGLTRSMLLSDSPEERQPTRHVVYYISTEVNRERLRRMFASRGWFDENDDPLFKADPDPNRPS